MDNLGSFVIVHGLVAVFLHQLVALGALQVFAHHFGDEFVEGDLGCPAQFLFGLARVAQQGLDFGRAEVTRVNLDDEIVLDCRVGW